MNIKSLRVFLSIMEHGTLTRASEHLNLSQPAASRLIQILESEIGETLFLRVRKRLQPTAEADLFLPEATHILNSIDNIPALFDANRAESNAPFRVLCLPRIVNGLVIPVLAALNTETPEIRFKVEVCPRREFGRRLLHGKYDIGLSSLPIPVDRLKTHSLTRVQLHVLLPKDHPLAGRVQLTADDLKDERYIALDEHTVVRMAVDQALSSNNIDMPVVHEVSNSEVAYWMVRNGMGFTFADPASIALEDQNAIALVPWALQPEIEVAYFLPDISQIHPIRDRFVNCLKRIASEKYSAHT